MQGKSEDRRRKVVVLVQAAECQHGSTQNEEKLAQWPRCVDLGGILGRAVVRRRSEGHNSQDPRDLCG